MSLRFHIETNCWEVLAGLVSRSVLELWLGSTKLHLAAPLQHTRSCSDSGDVPPLQLLHEVLQLNDLLFDVAERLQVEKALRRLRSHRARMDGLLRRRPTLRPAGYRGGHHGSRYQDTACIFYVLQNGFGPSPATVLKRTPKTYAATQSHRP